MTGRSCLALLFGLLGLWNAACGTEQAPDSADGDDGVLFADQFEAGASGQWQTESDESGTTAIQDGKMLIEIQAPNTLQFSTLSDPVFGDFDLEVEATQTGGDPQGSFGVLFRMRSPGEFYRFDITGDGRYMVERRNVDASWTRYVDDWRLTGALEQGSHVTNRLRVLARGSRLAFYANDQLLEEVSDDAYVRGNIALDAGTFGQTGLSVAFDNLIVRRP